MSDSKVRSASCSRFQYFVAPGCAGSLSQQKSSEPTPWNFQVETILISLTVPRPSSGTTVVGVELAVEDEWVGWVPVPLPEPGLCVDPGTLHDRTPARAARMPRRSRW